MAAEEGGMEFLIADTFTDSLARLTGEEQKVAKTTAFDLQLNPASPGMSFHKLDKAKDKNFWSVRVSGDLRVIVHRTQRSLMLCYVDHHDKAYRWAERRRLETHPTTGAAQFVEVRERVEEIARPASPPVAGGSSASPGGLPAAKPLLFAGRSAEELLGYGVPPEWVPDVLQADEDSVLVLAQHLPAEAGEALLELAVGRTPTLPPVAVSGADPFQHPDAQRRFRVMNGHEELERALAFPWEKWTTFLHPAQRQWVERDYAGPARVSGSAGTGKTIVALHRAVHLARQNPDARVLLTTFSETLASALRQKLHRLINTEPRLAERLEVAAMNAVGTRLHEAQFGKPAMLTRAQLEAFLREEAAKVEGARFTPAFVQGEWDELVDAWQLGTWEDYRDVKRLGRKTRLSEAQRATLWAVFSAVLERVRAAGLLTHAAIFTRLAEVLPQRPGPVFDFIVVDESQDVSVSQLRFLAALAGQRPNGLFFAGDLGQRIFQPPFSWKSVGVDIRGRSRSLRINYRTSHQIRRQADRLLSPLSPMSMAMSRRARAPSRSSTDRCLSPRRARQRRPKLLQSGTGSRNDSARGFLRRRWRSLSAPRQSSAGLVQRRNARDSPPSCWMKGWRAPGARPPSPSCTSPRGSSSGSSPSWLATTRSFPCRNGLSASRTARISKRSTIRSGTCSMSPAPVQETTCLSPASSLDRSSSTT